MVLLLSLALAFFFTWKEPLGRKAGSQSFIQGTWGQVGRVVSPESGGWGRAVSLHLPLVSPAPSPRITEPQGCSMPVEGPESLCACSLCGLPAAWFLSWN